MRSLSPFIALAILAFPAVAHAEENCPPGGWFCEEEAAPAEAPAEAPAAEPEAEPEAAPAPAPAKPPAARGGTTVVVPPGARVIVVDRPENAPAPPVKRRIRPAWGVNLRIQGAFFGEVNNSRGETIDSPHPDAGMGGLGASLRYRLTPHFALDAGIDRFRGKDFHGYDRTEWAYSLNGLIYANPRNAVQLYFLGGLFVSNASVQVPYEVTTSNSYSSGTTQQNYDYFGGQLGVGLEFRLSRRVALNTDLIGFIRGRTDAAAASQPEYTSPVTGQTTNSSGGGLFRGGITFYW